MASWYHQLAELVLRTQMYVEEDMAYNVLAEPLTAVWPTAIYSPLRVCTFVPVLYSDVL